MVYIANLKAREIDIKEEEKIEHEDDTEEIPVDTVFKLSPGDSYTKTKEITIKEVNSFKSGNLAKIIEDIASVLDIEIKNDIIDVSKLYDNNLLKEYEKNIYKNNSCFFREKESWKKKIEGDNVFVEKGAEVKNEYAYL